MTLGSAGKAAFEGIGEGAAYLTGNRAPDQPGRALNPSSREERAQAAEILRANRDAVTAENASKVTFEGNRDVVERVEKREILEAHGNTGSVELFDTSREVMERAEEDRRIARECGDPIAAMSNPLCTPADPFAQAAPGFDPEQYRRDAVRAKLREEAAERGRGVAAAEARALGNFVARTNALATPPPGLVDDQAVDPAELSRSFRMIDEAVARRTARQEGEQFASDTEAELAQIAEMEANAAQPGQPRQR